MSHYKDFSAADFALNESFQKWVLSPDDQTIRFWEDIVKNHPDKRKVIDEAIQLVRLSGISIDGEANTAYLEVWENVNKNAERELTNRNKSIFTRYTALAAAVVVILIVATYVLQTSNKQTIEYRTSYGEIKEVALDDGSTVMLNANSSLMLSESWNKDEREVLLQGEAFFNVVKTDDKKIFKVHIPSGMTIQVLGTRFNVNTRRESPSVYLQSGSVKLHTGNDSVTLRPGERADYEKSLQKMIVSHENQDDANNKLAWTSNLYIMNDLALSMITRDIEDNFGKEVIVMDSALNHKSVTAKVPARDLNVWLKVISETLDVEVEQKNNQLIITSRK